MPSTGIDAAGAVKGLSVPLGTLTDFAGQAMDVFNTNISPINIPVIGSLLPPLPIPGIGGFVKELDFSPVNQVTSWLQGLQNLLGPASLLASLGICDMANMNLTKPTVPDMNEYWGSSETTNRSDHLQNAYDTNVADDTFGQTHATAPIPNKGGASIASVVASYTKTQLDAAWYHLFPIQFGEPVSMVFPDTDIQCRPNFRVLFFCIPMPFCLPLGAAYNHVESVYNVHRPGHEALVPDILVTPMMEVIKTLERATSNWLPFIAIVMNKLETHSYWGSRNPEMVNTMASALFMATQDEATVKALEQNIKAQDMSGLLLPFVGDAMATTSMNSVLATGSLTGFGKLPIPGFLRKRSFILSAFPVHPFIRTWKDEYKAGFISDDTINPLKYFEVRSMVPTLLNTDSGSYSKVIANMYTMGRFLRVGQSQELDKDSVWEDARLPRNTGGLLHQPELCPNNKCQKPSVNPLSPNNCFSFRGRTLFPETTFANSTARTMCEVNQASFAEQRSCKAGIGKCPGPRDSYVPYDKKPEDFGCSSEYGEAPDPGTECIYDKYQFHNTHAAGLYHGSVLPEKQYPADENDLDEKESPLVSHYHRQRDCMDEEVLKVFTGGVFCGWAERCNDRGQFEPAPNCAATQRFMPGKKVPRTGCF